MNKHIKLPWRLNAKAGKWNWHVKERGSVYSKVIEIFVCLNVLNHFCEFYEWPAFYCMIIRWWSENLCVCIRDDDTYTRRNATWIHISEKQVVNNSNFTCMSGNDGGGGSVSINFVKSLSSLKIPMRCTIDHAMHIVCYSQSQYNNCIAQPIRYIFQNTIYPQKQSILLYMWECMLWFVS